MDLGNMITQLRKKTGIFSAELVDNTTVLVKDKKTLPLRAAR